MIEFAFFLPFMIMLLVGMVDICLLLTDQVNLSHLSREAASFMSRGASMQEAVDALVQADGNLNLNGSTGRIFVTTVFRPVGGTAEITGQLSAGSLSAASSVGTAGGQASIPNGMNLPEGMSLSVVELFSQRGLFGSQDLSGTLSILTLRSAAAF